MSGTIISNKGLVTKFTKIIAAGESLTSEFSIEGFKYAALFMPSAWTAASITFLAAYESGGTFNPVVGEDVVEYEITGVVASKVICLDIATGILAPLTWIKLRSGTSVIPVNQEVERSIIVQVMG